MRELTPIIQVIESGDQKAADELLPLVYQELRQLAAHKMANEAPGNTLQPTALVHEAWMRLAGSENQQWENRAHFFGAAAEAMRRILIDKARRKRALRHGSGHERVDLDPAEFPIPSAGDENELLAVHEALEKFVAIDKPKAELVKLRYFVGMTVEQAAEALGISAATAKRHWAYARAWLHQEIRGQETRRPQ